MKLSKLFLSGVLLLISAWSFAQDISLKGTVKDASTGGAVSGAIVQLKGSSTIYSITDADGKYSVKVPSTGTVVVSFLGYATIEASVSGRSTIDFSLEPDAEFLDELVVIGYGTVRKRDLTGSVASIKEDVLLATPTANVMTALQGRVAGLDVDASNNNKLVIRGHRSINGTNDPLIIIDGVQGGRYSDISPADIASVEVLKDASSTAIYGSQGANGVIIITTKSPEKGKVKVNYNAYAGYTMLPDEPERRVGDTWIAPRRIAAQNAGLWYSEADDLVIFGSNEALDAFRAGNWTDYRKLLSRNAFQQSHTLSVSGGNDKTTARFTANWDGNQSSRIGGKSDNFSIRSVVDQKVNDWLGAGVNLRVAHTNNESSPYRSAGGWALGNPYDEDGELVLYPIGASGYVNPLIDGKPNMNVSKSFTTRAALSGYVDLKPLQGLDFRTILTAHLSSSSSGSYLDKNSSGQMNGTATSIARMSKSTGQYLEWNNTLTYEKKFGDHKIGATLLTEYTKNVSESLTGSGTNQNISTNLWYALASTNSQLVSSNYVQTQAFSYAARINYNYLGRYMLTASLRRDGASVLAEGHKWASFPSVALAWRAVDEPWMVSTHTWLNDLKVRLSYGITGNSGISAYGTQSGVVAYNTKLALQDNPLLHYDFASTIGNTDTKWETSRSLDLGVDFSVLNGRIGGTVDLYNTDTYDLLLARKLPTSAGADGNFTIMQNIGRTNNKGIELTIDAYPIRNKDLVWKSTLTFARNVEKIVELIDGNDIALNTSIESSTLMIGRPISSYRGWLYQGIWKTSEADEAATYFQDASRRKPFKPGDYKLADQNDDGYIEYDKDYVFLGSRTPDWYAGFNNSIRWKNFDLNLYFYFRWGQWGANPISEFDPATGGSSPVYDKWIFSAGVNEDNAMLPALNSSMEAFDYYGYTSLWFIDRSFVKLKNVSLGYTIPKSLLNRINLSGCRVYFSAANPLYYSKHKFMVNRDPEGLSRNYILGLELSF